MNCPFFGLMVCSHRNNGNNEDIAYFQHICPLIYKNYFRTIRTISLYIRLFVLRALHFAFWRNVPEVLLYVQSCSDVLGILNFSFSAPKKYCSESSSGSSEIYLTCAHAHAHIHIISHMSNITIFISLPPYLAQWYRHRCGGKDPISPVRGSYESNVIEEFLAKMPEGVEPQLFPREDEVAIAIPSFRAKPPEYYNYLPPKARHLLENSIKVEFEIDMWQSLRRFKHVSANLKDLILAYMEKHKIEDTETNFLAISKAYQRKRQCHQKQSVRNVEAAEQTKS